MAIEPLASDHGPIARAGSDYEPGGKFSDPNATVYSLLFAAYDLPAYRFDLHALPNWAHTAAYSIEANPAETFPNLPPAENIQQIRLMLRSMLIHRFQLVVHHETRQIQAYVMTLGKGTLKNATPGDASKRGGVGSVSQNGIVRFRGTNVAMSQLADRVGLILGRPVINKTNLSGQYSFDVRSVDPDAARRQPANGSCGPDCVSLVIGTLSNQLGLKLRSSTASADFVVVDHIERPGPN